MKADFSCPVVRIDTVLVPFFSTVWFTGMSKVRGTSSMLVMWSGWIFLSVILSQHFYRFWNSVHTHRIIRRTADF